MTDDIGPIAPDSGTGDSRVGDLAGLAGVRIIRGEPDDVELAALLAAVAAAQIASAATDLSDAELPPPIQAARSAWCSRARKLSGEGSASIGPLGAASMRFGRHRPDAWRLSLR